MTGLQGLDVSIRLHQSNLRLEKLWLSPVMNVRGLKKFILDISYMAYDIFDNEADYVRPNAETLRFRRKLTETVCQPRSRQIRSLENINKSGIENTDLEIDDGVRMSTTV